MKELGFKVKCLGLAIRGLKDWGWGVGAWGINNGDWGLVLFFGGFGDGGLGLGMWAVSLQTLLTHSTARHSSPTVRRAPSTLGP